jgi:hypothetical protein
MLKSLELLKRRNPGNTDIDEVADALRQEARQREHAQRSRLYDEAKQIRGDARSIVWRKEAVQEQINETRALTAKEPPSVIREFQRADELMVRANGLPGPDDVPPPPAAAPKSSGE